MAEIRENLQLFGTAAALFGKKLDDWILRFPQQALQEGMSRADILESRRPLDLISGALRWGPSVGLYGESQCGKSNLVSRFAKGLGAEQTPEGSLLVNDPTIESQRGTQRWFRGADQPAGIEFATWIDPGGGRESTGIVCRFTRERIRDVEPGHFLVQLMSTSELLSSIALGYDAEVKEIPDIGRAERITKTLSRLKMQRKEPDTSNVMVQLLDAWKFLSQENVLNGTSRFSALDNGADGWDDFVRECYKEGERPIMKANADEPSDFDELVSLLWDSAKPMTRLWRRLHADLQKLRGMKSISVPATVVCKDRPRDGLQMSLVAVDWMKSLNKDGCASCTVRGRAEGQKEPMSVGMSCASIVSLARELVLPIGTAGCAESELIDVLDYPGARAETGALDLEDPERANDNAVEALLRGKINRLFVAAVDMYDATTLCLAVGGTGNLEAPRPVIRALGTWLAKQGWEPRSSNGPRNTMDDAPEDKREPPLVVAMTKSDMLFAKGADKFKGKLDDLKSKYCQGLDWMDNWHEGSPFQHIYWVHNPSVVGVAKISDIDPATQNECVATCLNLAVFNQHVADPEARLRAMLETPPTDVDLLFRKIKSITDTDSRSRRMAQLTLEALSELVEKANSAYIGKGDKERTEAERACALAHVDALSKALMKTQAVSDFLRALDLPSSTIERCYRKAAHAAAGDQEEGSGVVDFESFFDQLLQAFFAKFEKEVTSTREIGWVKELRRLSKVQGTSLVSEIQSRFRQIPSSAWFKKSIENATSDLFQMHNAGTLPIQALGSITAMAWSRNMVWMNHVPTAPLNPAALPPIMRAGNAASVSILSHWRQYLPDAYAALVDPSKCTQLHNQKLGEVRKELHDEIKSFLDAVTLCSAQSDGWSSIQKRLIDLQVSLVEKQLEGAA